MPKTLSCQDEYSALTEGCGLVDRSERGKLALTGSEAKGFLQGQVTNDVEGLTPGTGCYAAFLTNKGKMRGDLRILDRGDELRWTDRAGRPRRTSSTSSGSSRSASTSSCTSARSSAGCSRSSGPRRARVAGADGPARGRARQPGRGRRRRPRPARRHRPRDRRRVRRRGHRAPWPPPWPSAAPSPSRRPWPRSCASSPAGPATASSSTSRSIPQEAGLNSRAVSFTKGCYVGQETVARLFYRGKPNRHLRGLRLSAPAIPGDRAAARREGRRARGLRGRLAGPRAHRAGPGPPRGRARGDAGRGRGRRHGRARRAPLPLSHLRAPRRHEELAETASLQAIP